MKNTNLTASSATAGYEPAPATSGFLQGGAASQDRSARHAHNVEVGGSNPSPATNLAACQPALRIYNSASRTVAASLHSHTNQCAPVRDAAEQALSCAPAEVITGKWGARSFGTTKRRDGDRPGSAIATQAGRSTCPASGGSAATPGNGSEVGGWRSVARVLIAPFALLSSCFRLLSAAGAPVLTRQFTSVSPGRLTRCAPFPWLQLPPMPARFFFEPTAPDRRVVWWLGINGGLV